MTTTKEISYGLSVLPQWHAARFNSETNRVEGEGDGVMWSGAVEPPAVGDRVLVTVNGLGPGAVTGYFIEHGWLGVYVRLDSPPDWWVKQNERLDREEKWRVRHGDMKRGACMVFGAEIKEEGDAEAALAEAALAEELDELEQTNRIKEGGAR
jgi:hypothetical protein